MSHDRPSRRAFLGSAIATAVATRTVGADDSRTGLPLTVAGYPYERVRAIQDGRVGIDGCRVTFEEAKIADLNRHVLGGKGTYDVAEVGLIPYLLAFCNDGFRDYLLLPAFVLKVFRHKSIFVRTDGPVRKPEDLRGRRVASVGYSSSGLTWIRGILEDEYGVKPSDLRWVLTPKDSAAGQTGGVSPWEKRLPKGLTVERAPEGEDESRLLLAGKVDAILHPAEPKAFVDRDPRVRRLFPDARQVESKYFEKTGIFPIMHVVAIRRELSKAQPWLPGAVMRAYAKARDADYEEMNRIRWAYSSLPWFGQELDRTRASMGPDFYSYGVEKNRKALETVLRYLHRQGLATRQMKVSELFAEQFPDRD